MDALIQAALIGTGATAVMDLWGVARARAFGVPAPDYGLVGRWIGWMPRGRFRHAAIKAAAPVRGEKAIGWIAHYVIGMTFAGVLVASFGTEPQLKPALAVGIGTVLAPFFLMQPGMGMGIAASRMPRPNAARVQNLVTHAVFGLGLFLSASLVNSLQ
jgi:hypothetical protein